ncbi:hypothetical protein RclHR1_01600024 [Rhizophagus clarus]|jgi:hypothetical protein|uniref:Uncharacterized protein n=1 Tax=Rhizophagus clarus TaxID=94130 RepID=A0A2Z6QKT0_9GLOM|nr:hypothetical protein RclHR1_01600024 [Rhizophagus clarus]GES94025.1 hypothetical protein GLOIN_2v1499445 [Rhizophagus clarus]
MASKFSFVFVLLAVLCLSVVSFASPIKDVSSTTMAISETKTSDSEHFAVAVQRVDDLLNDNGEILAERIDAVIVNFDLKDDQLLVNNVPVELGISSFQVIEAQVVPANIKIEQLEEYADNFDIGLVTVQVSTVAESLPTNEEGVTLRRISISLRIIEIDGVSVIQPQDAVEKVLEFKVFEISDGDKDVTVPFYPAEDLSSHDQIHNGEEKQLEEHKESPLHPLTSHVRHWWRCSSRLTRIVLASLFLTILFGVFFMAIPAAVQTLITLVRRQPSSSHYSAVSFDDDETVTEQVIFIADEEKRALMEQEKELKQ